MSRQSQHILQLLYKAVETDQIKLPTLPEVALKIRRAVEKGDRSAADIAELLSQDSSLSARLLQLANSPLYRARNEINNLQMAITRLGTRIVKDLVVMLAIKQAFATRNKEIEKQFRKIWQTSIDVASACRVLATSQNKLDTEQAVLAGLIHNIGALPIIELAERRPSLFNQDQDLACICEEIQGALGEKILSFWNFPQTLIDVVAQWNNFNRQHSGDADYVDIVQAGILHTPHAPSNVNTDWSCIAAIKNLGLDPDMHEFNDTMQNQLNETRASLMNI